ncbi:MAG: class II glutamine amidotransferase [Candidatus Bathyarchaeia archaeon]
MLSTKTSTARKYLLEDPCSLYIQSKINPERLQGDGWGIGFYVNGTPRLIKSEKPVYAEHERFNSVVSAANSSIIVAHIRRASNPRGLPSKRLISIDNSQPFQYGRYIFAHNGTINIPDEVAERLGDWKQNIRGVNDSEVYFWYVVKELECGVSFQEALMGFQKTLSDLWRENREKHSEKSRPYVGLNIVFSDGEKLYAYCKYDGRDEAVKSLCYQDQPALQMSYIVSSTSLVVASEKTNREDDWRALESNNLLIGQIVDETISVELQKI